MYERGVKSFLASQKSSCTSNHKTGRDISWLTDTVVHTCWFHQSYFRHSLIEEEEIHVALLLPIWTSGPDVLWKEGGLVSLAACCQEKCDAPPDAQLNYKTMFLMMHRFMVCYRALNQDCYQSKQPRSRRNSYISASVITTSSMLKGSNFSYKSSLALICQCFQPWLGQEISNFAASLLKKSIGITPLLWYF